MISRQKNFELYMYLKKHLHVRGPRLTRVMGMASPRLVRTGRPSVKE